MDFGAERIVALIADKKDGCFRILGAADAATAGMTNGEVTHLGDAAEATREALSQAERAAGLSADTVYYNFDDADMAAASPRGHKTLRGEGEIRPVDVADACETAERMVRNFERRIVYSRTAGFLIDDRDAVANPVGVFGRKLEVSLYVLLARSLPLEDRQRLFRRLGVAKSVPVPSAWSTAYGIIPNEDRRRPRIVADMGRDFLTVFSFEQNRISRHCCVLTAECGASIGETAARLVRQLAADSPFEAILVTGDRAEDEGIMQAFSALGAPAAHVCAPIGIAKLEHPSFASAAGLIRVADELDAKKPILHDEKGLLSAVREKAGAFINEYF